ncbi:MAG: hypothetical protein IK104_01985 [Clostridia bacterium]|nr:hypothetical protein [Clostridia bacterium]
MKRKAAGLIAVLLTALLIFAACGGGTQSELLEAGLAGVGAPAGDLDPRSVDPPAPTSAPEPTEALSSAPAEPVTEPPVTEPVTEAPTEPPIEPATAATAPDLADEPSAAAAPPAAPAAVGGATEIVPNFDYRGALDVSGIAVYTFTIEQRGMVGYRFVVPENALAPGDWQVRLYQLYYLNGVSGEQGRRLLNLLEADNVTADRSSPHIGVLPGDYVIEVTPGENFSSAGYTLTLSYSAGAAYEIECNDTPSRYTAIYPDAPLKGSGSVYGSAGTDVDWYLVRLWSPAAITLLFSHETRDLTTVPFVVTLYDTDGLALYTGRSAFTEAVLTSGTLGLAAGDYLVKVEARVQSELDYTLLLRRSLSGVYEQEPNDDMSAATPLSFGVDVHGAVSDKAGVDRDWFRLTPSEPGYIRLTLGHPGYDETDDRDVRRVTLVNAKGEAIWSGVLSNWDDVLLSPEIGVYASDYYVLVDDENLYHVDGEYVLSCVFVPDAYREREYNGDWDRANEIDLNMPVTGTLTDVGTAFDEDWYRFTVIEAKTLRLRLSHTAGTYPETLYEIDVYDSHGRPVLSGSCADDLASLELDADYTPGVYFVRVAAGQRSSSEPYRLFVGDIAP